MIEQYRTKQIKQNTIQCVSVVVEYEQMVVRVIGAGPDEMVEMQTATTLDCDEHDEHIVMVIDIIVSVGKDDTIEKADFEVDDDDEVDCEVRVHRCNDEQTTDEILID